MRRHLSLAGLLFFLASPIAAQQAGMVPIAQYTVRIQTVPKLSATVTATLPTVPATLTMGTGAIDHLPDGWSTFVSGVALTNAAGAAMDLSKTMDSTRTPTWTVKGDRTGPGTLTYSVDLRFAQESWPPGNEQAGLWADSALFLVTKSLFLTPEGDGPSSVTFDLPAGWRASTPWAAKDRSPASFMAPNRESLVYNTVVLGHHGVYQFTSGDFDVVLALIGPAARSVDIVRQTFEPVLKEYFRIFEATPPTTYLMTLFYGEDEDGEGFHSSAAFRTRVPLARDTRLVWGNHLAHELLHMWNGHQLRGADQPASQWFQEGFTEYLSNRTLLRTRMITREDFTRKLENNISLYSYFRLSGIYDTVSVRQSGTRKWRYRFGVYNGGWAVAFALDQTIRQQTNERHGLEDFMRRLYARRGLADQPWTWEDLITTATETAGTDMTGFFTSYVAGLEPLPLGALLQRLGIRLVGQTYAAEMYVLPDLAASAEQRARGKAYFDGVVSGGTR